MRKCHFQNVDMKQILFLCFLPLFFCNALAQQNVTLQLRVNDCESNKALPFANIYSKSIQNGSATNFEGAFSFTTSIQDTLEITFIGYEKFILPVKKFLDQKQICLVPKAVQLGDVEITAKSTFLYELVTRCRANRLTKPTESKTYLLLKSKVNNQQVELLEAYYNGKYRNYNVDRLDLKIGRIFLAPYNESFFVSLGTSQGINMHKTFGENLFFPSSPLELNKKKMIRKFDLIFHEKFKQDGSSIYVIDFKKKGSSYSGFNGRIWLDSTKSELIKVVLKNEEGNSSPFIPVGNAQEIDDVKFDITKTFQTINGIRTIRSIDFNYQLSYTRENSNQVTVETKAILFAYQYADEFLLPTFQKEYFLNDYQSMSLAPYNRFFWEENQEFKLATEEKDKNLFINRKTTNFIDSFSYNPTTRIISFQQPTYRRWNSKRVYLADFMHQGENSSSVNLYSIYARYRIDIKIYMDINPIGDSVDVQLATIFDPFTSYSYLEKSPETLAFINMLFDLAEIQKRKLAKEIEGMKDVNQIQEKYEDSIAEFEEIASDYYISVVGGTKLNGMKSWNDYILSELGIDNFAAFDL